MISSGTLEDAFDGDAMLSGESEYACRHFEDHFGLASQRELAGHVAAPALLASRIENRAELARLALTSLNSLTAKRNLLRDKAQDPFRAYRILWKSWAIIKKLVFSSQIVSGNVLKGFASFNNNTRVIGIIFREDLAVVLLCRTFQILKMHVLVDVYVGFKTFDVVPSWLSSLAYCPL